MSHWGVLWGLGSVHFVCRPSHYLYIQLSERWGCVRRVRVRRRCRYHVHRCALASVGDGGRCHLIWYKYMRVLLDIRVPCGYVGRSSNAWPTTQSNTYKCVSPQAPAGKVCGLTPHNTITKITKISPLQAQLPLPIEPCMLRMAWVM